MSVDVDGLSSLPAAEKLRIVELLWDQLGELSEPIPLPEWLDQEAVRRRDELLADPSAGLDHEEAWRRISERHG